MAASTPQCSGSFCSAFACAPSEACLPEPLLCHNCLFDVPLDSREGEKSQWWSAPEHVDFSRAARLVGPRSSPEVLHLQGHSCPLILRTDRYRSCPAGDLLCMSAAVQDVQCLLMLVWLKAFVYALSTRGLRDKGRSGICCVHFCLSSAWQEELHKTFTSMMNCIIKLFQDVRFPWNVL